MQWELLERINLSEQFISGFKISNGHMDTYDAERSGRPASATTPEITNKIHNILLNTCKKYKQNRAAIAHDSSKAVSCEVLDGWFATVPAESSGL